VKNREPWIANRDGQASTICDSRLAVWQEGDPHLPFRSRNWTCMDRWVTS